MKLEIFKDKRGILTWASTKLTEFDYKYLAIGTIKKGYSRGGHYHKRIVEKVLCVKGLLELDVAGYKIILKEGDLMQINKEVPHILKNIGNDEAFFVEFKSEEFNENDKDTYIP